MTPTPCPPRLTPLTAPLTAPIAPPALAPTLARLLTEGGSGNRLTLEGDRGFMVVSAARGGGVGRVQAAAMRRGRDLSEEEAQRLYDLGFRRRTAADPFEQSLPIYGEADRLVLGALLSTLMGDLYLTHGAPLDARLHLGDAPTLVAQRLQEAMKRASEARDNASRQSLYWAFVRGRLLLALDAPAEELAGATPRSFKALTGYESAAVFTSWEESLRYDARGLDVVECGGRELLPLLLERGVGSLLVNPRGRLGGEFYRNELASMDEAMRAWGGSL
jgi:hypothetical protein